MVFFLVIFAGVLGMGDADSAPQALPDEEQSENLDPNGNPDMTTQFLELCLEELGVSRCV